MKIVTAPSNCLAQQNKQLLDKQFYVTPYGVQQTLQQHRFLTNCCCSKIIFPRVFRCNNFIFALYLYSSFLNKFYFVFPKTLTIFLPGIMWHLQLIAIAIDCDSVAFFQGNILYLLRFCFLAESSTSLDFIYIVYFSARKRVQRK